MPEHATANRRLVLDAFGEDAFRIVDEPPPDPGPGQVRLRVLAASVQFTDTLIRRGIYPGLRARPPFTPGYDVVGEVDALGPGVMGLAPGDRVADLTVTGSYARYLLRDAAGLTPVPAAVDPAAAATLVLSWMTAQQLLERVARVAPEQRVLIHAAGGAVGDAALQLCRLRGAAAVGTARPHHHERIRALGGEPIDYRGDWAADALERSGGEGYHAVLDPIGEDGFRPSWRLVRRGGTLAAFGFQARAQGEERGGGPLAIPLAFARVLLWNLLPNGRRAAFYSIGAERTRRPERWREDLRALLALLERGEIDPRVGERIGFEAVADAHRRLERGGVQGKIVLIPERG